MFGFTRDETEDSDGGFVGRQHGRFEVDREEGGAAQWVETVCRRRVHFIPKKPLSHERGSERSEPASERVSAAEGASEASTPEPAND